jgi:hypothetical protein
MSSIGQLFASNGINQYDLEFDSLVLTNPTLGLTVTGSVNIGGVVRYAGLQSNTGPSPITQNAFQGVLTFTGIAAVVTQQFVTLTCNNSNCTSAATILVNLIIGSELTLWVVSSVQPSAGSFTVSFGNVGSATTPVGASIRFAYQIINP